MKFGYQKFPNLCYCILLDTQRHTYWIVDVEHVVVRVPCHSSQFGLSILVDHNGSILIEETKEGGASGTSLKPNQKGR